MITIKNPNTTRSFMTDRLVTVSACSLGFSASLLIDGPGLGNGTGLSGGLVAAHATPMPATGLSVLGGLERVERPTEAPTAVETETQAKTYVSAAASAKTSKQTQQYPTKWAFRGLEPWSDPA
ncbi:hypothetical protein ACWDR0_09640 [Streptomyces sp. NPDC003691]